MPRGGPLRKFFSRSLAAAARRLRYDKPYMWSPSYSNEINLLLPHLGHDLRVSVSECSSLAGSIFGCSFAEGKVSRNANITQMVRW